jgi:hypothetical protein
MRDLSVAPSDGTLQLAQRIAVGDELDRAELVQLGA